jgi:hypothetical protein
LGCWLLLLLTLLWLRVRLGRYRSNDLLCFAAQVAGELISCDALSAYCLVLLQVLKMFRVSLGTGVVPMVMQ